MKRYAKAGSSVWTFGGWSRARQRVPRVRVEDVLWPTKESDRNRQGRAPLAAYSGVTLRDLIEREGEGS